MRCAIYARKSADEAADNQFGSIDAQRELCEKYIGSQAEEGWQALSARYDDIGFSGGTTRRPALQRLIEDVAGGAVDIVVVYKIDRLSRSLRDFLDLISLFERHKVTFVAVTQSFNTTTSMGRLTLNVLLSFAQFEREITGERLRDWFAGARQRGLWVNGRAPFGYRAVDLHLAVDEQQAAVVRTIFDRYPVLGSARLLARELNALGHLNNVGRPLSKSNIRLILLNRLYRGDLVHRGEPVAGHHEAIVSEKAFRRAQKVIAESARRRAALRRLPVEGMLKGILFHESGYRLNHTFVHSRGRVYRYYIPRDSYGRDSRRTSRYRAAHLERAVLDQLSRLGGETIGALDDPATAGHVRRTVARVDVAPTSLQLTLIAGGRFEVPHSAMIRLPITESGEPD